LDDADLRIKLAQAESELGAVESGIIQIETEIKAARHHAETAAGDLARYEELRSRGTATAQKLEQAEDVSTATRATVEAANAQLREVNAKRDAARQTVALIESQIEKSVVRAPSEGTITIKAVEAGEVVQAGQTLTVLVDMSRLELKTFVAEENLGKVRIGAPARVGVSAFPDQFYEATVARVDEQAQFTPREVHMPEERARMVFGVTFLVDNPGGTLKPGMPADSWMLWQDGASWPETLFVPR
jgi:HlyD family secretion protein